MGLDERQSHVNKQKKKQRVLSQNYLLRVASIGAWGKRSFDKRSSFRLSTEEQREFKDAFVVIEALESDKGNDSFSGKGGVDLRSSRERNSHGSTTGGNPKLVRELENGFVKDMLRKYGHDSTSMVPGLHLEPNNERCPSSRKIVILKPKAGEAETDEKDKGFLDLGNGISHAQVKERKNFPDGVKSVACRSNRSSETEMEITRKTRDDISDISLEPPRLGFSDAYDLTNEPEFMMVSSRNNSEVNNQYKPSYVAQEAKQQISERWRMTKEFQENGLAIRGKGRSKTLGEMLALPDCAKRANSLGPLGISSRDGWKNVGAGDPIDSESQPYSTSFGSPYITMRPVFPWSRRKSIKHVSCGQDSPKRRNSGSNCKQSQSSPELESEKNHLPEENSLVSKSLKHGAVQEMSAEDRVVPESSMFLAASLSIVSDVMVSVETPSAGKSDGNHNQQRFEQTGSTMSEKDHDSSFCIPDAWSRQEVISTKMPEECSTDPDFLVNLETANQPSPVSVLEAPFSEGNLLSSKCFLSVTASLNDVKRQLEFIKSESIEEYSEVPGMVVLSESEKDCEYSTKLFAVTENRDFSYLVDVLTEAGFHSINLDILSNGWNSPETPISPSVFEKLEKKYGEQISWKRAARKLLFDHINSGLTEILQPCLGDPMWTKPVARRLSYSWNSKEIEKELYMMLVSQEKEAKKNQSEKVFGMDDGWLSLGYEIEAIGREIENSLIDELAAEIVSL